jgi:hypothetical protein
MSKAEPVQQQYMTLFPHVFILHCCIPNDPNSNIIIIVKCNWAIHEHLYYAPMLRLSLACPLPPYFLFVGLVLLSRVSERGRFGFQNSLSVHNITWLGQGTFTYEEPSYLRKKQWYILGKKQQHSTDMSVTTNYSFNNIIINIMTNFGSSSPAQLLRTTPSSPYQTKTFPTEKINQTGTQLMQLA